ncbi:MAG: cupin domain-containing protein [Acutalibacteraceae bacterium]
MNRYNNQNRRNSRFADRGPEPFCISIVKAVCENENFRTALWTGDNLQVTLMCIPVGGEIGLENHRDTDQFLRIESGMGAVKMGCHRDTADFKRQIGAGDAVFIPAGTWHNIVNTGSCPLKVYSVYAPPKHPKGTVHKTKSASDDAED